MKILYLEDHEFFASEIIEYIEEDTQHDVYYAKTYQEAEKLLQEHKSFDASILDVILQNGKTGLLLAETYDARLGKIMFVTGCTDNITINAISKYKHIAKIEVIWDKLNEFLDIKTSV